MGNQLSKRVLISEEIGGDTMNNENDKSVDKKKEGYGGDPHHPDHPRNRGKGRSDKEKTEEPKAERNERYGGDPHHPNHPRNRE